MQLKSVQMEVMYKYYSRLSIIRVGWEIYFPG
jgi:hypothetical protein